VENWSVKGISYSTKVANIAELVVWMNTVDPQGKWTFETQSFAIVGGAQNVEYGKMTIQQIPTGISSQLAANIGAKYTAVTLPMTPGLHDLTVTNKVDGCSENTRIELYCITVATMTKELVVGENDELCLDFTQLPGEIISVKKPWENAAIPCAAIEWKPEEQCLLLTGKAAGIDKICVTACDNMGLCDSVFVILTVREKFPALRIYNGFSPNEDGVNDAFKIENIEYYPNHHLQIFNANGLMVFESTNYQNDWKGTWNGSLLAIGTYYYILQDGAGKTLNGYIQISR
jgi:gliding motility-associated-like protein